MNSQCLSQPISVLLATSKHNTHDEFWLIQGDVSYFCFACAVENLEDAKVLVVRKKKVASHFLTALVQNSKIWRVLSNKQDVITHVFRLFVSLLSENRDGGFVELIRECCVVMVRKSNPAYTGNVINMILSSQNLFVKPIFTQLLSDIVELAPSAVECLFNDHGKYAKEILLSVRDNESYQVWRLVFLILKFSTIEQRMLFPRAMLKDFVTSMVDRMNSTSESFLIDLINSLSIIANCKYLRISLQTHECSKFITTQQSFVENLKKVFLSPNEDIQISAIKCMTSLCRSDINNPIVSIVLEKGVNEFLLELLSSKSANVLLQTYLALHQLVNFEIFITKGHLIFSLSSIIDSIKYCCALSAEETFYTGFSLFKAMLNKMTKSQFNSISDQQINHIFYVLEEAFSLSQERFKILAVSCLVVCLKISSTLRIDVYKKIFELLDSFFEYIQTEVTSTFVEKRLIDFACDIYRIVMLLASRLNAMNQIKDQEATNFFIDRIFFIVDKLCIPEAVLKFLKNFEFQEVFYEMMLMVLELDVDKGELLSIKLAETSFLQNILEFKVLVGKKSQEKSSIKHDEVAAKLLLYLCLAVEKDELDNVFKDELYSSLLMFNISFNKWKFLLGQQSLVLYKKDLKFLSEARLCILALLAYSHLAEQCFTSMAVLRPYLEQIVASKKIIESLGTLSKRYLIYLWCQIDMVHIDQSLQYNIIKLCESSMNISCAFVTCLNFLIWCLKTDATVTFKKKVIVLHLSNAVKKPFIESYDQVIDSLKTNDVRTDFIEVLISVIGVSKDAGIINYGYSLFLNLIETLNAEDYNQVKCSIRLFMLINENEITTTNISAVFRCLNSLEVFEKCIEINDDEFKIYCRSLKHAGDNLAPSLQVQVLNFINVILSKAQAGCDSRFISLFLNNAEILKGFQENLFKADISALSQSSLIAEQINSLSIVLLAEILLSFRKFSINTEARVKISKTVFIDGLMFTDLPLIQIALLVFWKEFILLKCELKLIELFDQLNGENISCVVNQDDINLLFICFQNLLYHSEVIIRQLAAECIESLEMNLNKKVSVLHNSWDEFIVNGMLKRAMTEKVDYSVIRLLTMFVQAKECIHKEVLEVVFEICKNLNEYDVLFLYNFLQLIDKLLFAMKDIPSLVALKNNVRELTKPIVKHNTLEFKFFRGVILSRHHKVVDIESHVKQIKRKLEKRIDVLQSDDASTESD